MPHFFCKLITPRPTFVSDMTESERALMERHAAYWMAMLKEGTVLAFGPVMDTSGHYGMGIMQAADEDEAKSRAAADPAITAQIGFKVEISPMRAFTRESVGQ
jgi:uncharacterized protein YciI